MADKRWGWDLDLALSDLEVYPMRYISTANLSSGEKQVQVDMSGVGKSTSPNLSFPLFT